MKIEIEHLPQIGGTPFYRSALNVHNQMMNEDLADDCPPHWDHQALVATSGSELVGAIIFVAGEWNKSFSIAIGWVAPKYRRQGVYRQLWDALVVRARRGGYTAIFGTTKVDNKNMRAVALSFGRVEESVNLRYVVEQ